MRRFDPPLAVLFGVGSLSQSQFSPTSHQIISQYLYVNRLLQKLNSLPYFILEVLKNGDILI